MSCKSEHAEEVTVKVSGKDTRRLGAEAFVFIQIDGWLVSIDDTSFLICWFERISFIVDHRRLHMGKRLMAETLLCRRFSAMSGSP